MKSEQIKKLILERNAVMKALSTWLVDMKKKGTTVESKIAICKFEAELLTFAK